MGKIVLEQKPEGGESVEERTFQGSAEVLGWKSDRHAFAMTGGRGRQSRVGKKSGAEASSEVKGGRSHEAFRAGVGLWLLL